MQAIRHPDAGAVDDGCRPAERPGADGFVSSATLDADGKVVEAKSCDVSGVKRRTAADIRPP